MAIALRIVVQVGLWLAEHPDQVKKLIDEIVAAKAAAK